MPKIASSGSVQKKHQTSELQSQSLSSSAPRFPLYLLHEVPAWLQSNEYILSGYRANYSTSMCLRSLFHVHNETGNVWTHVVGIVFLIVFSISFFALSSMGRPMDAYHWAVFIPYVFGAIMCMSCSAGFHLFSAHECHAVYHRMLLLDYVGITCLAITSFFPPMYLAFQCTPWLQVLYLSMIGLVGAVGLVGPFCAFWNDPKFSRWRICVYSMMGVCGVFPMIHARLIIPQGASSGHLLGLSFMMVCYAGGTVIYVSRIPERWFPGRFDLWLNSHQLWHTLVLCAVVVHCVTCAAMYVHLEPMILHC